MKSSVRVLIPLYTLLALMFVAGCAPPTGTPVSIVSPGNGSINNSPPQFVVSYASGADTSGVVLWLNGAPVQNYFNFGDSQATLDGADVESFLRQGNNTLQANPPAGPTVSFIYDTEGPKVVIQHVTDTNPIEVSGRLEDPSGVASLTVNGSPATIDGDDNFTVSVDPAADYDFVSVDNGGLSSDMTIVAPGTVFQRIVTARVSQQAMDFIAGEVGPLLKTMDFAPLLPEMNRLLNNALRNNYPLLRAITGEVTITGIHFNGDLDAALDMQPSSSRGVIGFDASMADIMADLHIQLFNLNVGAYITNVDATGNAEVYGNNGDVAVEMSDLSILLQGLSVTVQGLSSNFINQLANALLPPLKGLIGKMVQVVVNDILDQMLTEIGDSFFVDINGATLGLTPTFESFSSDDTTLHVVLGGKLEAVTMNESVPPVLGSLYTSTPLPDAPDIGSHIFAAVSSNLVNQAFMSAFQAGIHHLALYNQNELHLGIDDRPAGNPGDERWLINPGQPAHFRVRDTVGDPTVFLVMDGLNVQIQKNNGGNWIDIANVDLDFEARVTLGVNPDETLKVTFSGAPIITANHVEIILLGEIDTNFVNGILNQFILPAIMPELAKTTQSIELPSLLGYRIAVDDFQALGGGDGHLGLGLTLSKDQTTTMTLSEGAVEAAVAQ